MIIYYYFLYHHYYYYYYYQPFDRRRSTTTVSWTCPLVRLAWSGLEKTFWPVISDSAFGCLLDRGRRQVEPNIGPKLSPKWAQVAPNMALTWAQIALELAQAGPSRPKSTQVGPKVAQTGPKLTQTGPKLAPSWPKLAHLGSKFGFIEGQGCSKNGSRRDHGGPRSPGWLQGWLWEPKIALSRANIDLK